jgi:hypothetical protein
MLAGTRVGIIVPAVERDLLNSHEVRRLRRLPGRAERPR